MADKLEEPIHGVLNEYDGVAFKFEEWVDNAAAKFW